MIMVFVDMQVEGGLWAKQDTRNKTCGPQRKKEQRPHDSKSVQGSEEERLRAKGGEGGRGRGRGGGGGGRRDSQVEDPRGWPSASPWAGRRRAEERESASETGMPVPRGLPGLQPESQQERRDR